MPTITASDDNHPSLKAAELRRRDEPSRFDSD